MVRYYLNITRKQVLNKGILKLHIYSHKQTEWRLLNCVLESPNLNPIFSPRDYKPVPDLGEMSLPDSIAVMPDIIVKDLNAITFQRNCCLRNFLKCESHYNKPVRRSKELHPGYQLSKQKNNLKTHMARRI